MICGGVIDASVARLQPGLRAQTCARGGDQQAGWVLRNHKYLRSTLEQRAKGNPSVHVVGKSGTVERRAA